MTQRRSGSCGTFRPKAAAPEPTSTTQPPRRKRPNQIIQRCQKAIADASAAVARQLDEANQWGIARLMEIFGVEFVGRIAASARERYDAAQALDHQAAEPGPNSAPVITSKGTPRTPGGVFFYLMREHANSLNLDWYGLHIPSPPREPTAGGTPQPQRAQQAPDASTEAGSPASQAFSKTPAVPETDAP